MTLKIGLKIDDVTYCIKMIEGTSNQFHFVFRNSKTISHHDLLNIGKVIVAKALYLVAYQLRQQRLYTLYKRGSPPFSENG